MDGADLDGRNIRVNLAEDKQRRGGRRYRGGDRHRNNRW